MNLSTDFSEDDYNMIDRLSADLEDRKRRIRVMQHLAAAIIHSEYLEEPSTQNNSNSSSNWKNKLD